MYTSIHVYVTKFHQPDRLGQRRLWPWELWKSRGKNMKITTIFRWWNVISFAPVFASWDSAASSSRQYWLSIQTNITDSIYVQYTEIYIYIYICIYVWCRVLNVLKITAAVVLHSVPLQCTTGAVHPLQIPMYIYIYIYIAPIVLRLPTGRRLSSKFGVFTYSTACFSLVHARNKLRGDRATAVAAADSCCRKAIW